VIDPIDELGADFYLLEAADLGLALAGVIDTHVHADYVSLAGTLATASGCHRYAHASLHGVARWPFLPVEDGQELRAGRLVLTTLHTPGHTPEHIALVVRDETRSVEPCAVLTGDSLLVGDVGRPDLLVGEQAIDGGDQHERAAQQFHSLERLLALPDFVEVFPGHYGGSACGGVNMSGKASSTIGFERRFNQALQRSDERDFEDFVLQTLGPAPDGHARNKLVNLGIETSVAGIRP
jgi:glyoxylase-like metal-dependent hydrolase (beta-lactamase superfamily II)